MSRGINENSFSTEFLNLLMSNKIRDRNNYFYSQSFRFCNFPPQFGSKEKVGEQRDLSSLPNPYSHKTHYTLDIFEVNIFP